MFTGQKFNDKNLGNVHYILQRLAGQDVFAAHLIFYKDWKEAGALKILQMVDTFMDGRPAVDMDGKPIADTDAKPVIDTLICLDFTYLHFGNRRLSVSFTTYFGALIAKHCSRATFVVLRADECTINSLNADTFKENVWFFAQEDVFRTTLSNWFVEPVLKRV